MPEEKEKKDLFYTKLFEKCYPKSKETDEFEECCKDGMAKHIVELGKEAINKGGDYKSVSDKPPFDSLKKSIGKILDDENDGD